MEYAGVVPMDAPDPSADFEARLRGLSYPVFQLRPQPSLTRIPVSYTHLTLPTILLV